MNRTSEGDNIHCRIMEICTLQPAPSLKSQQLHLGSIQPLATSSAMYSTKMYILKQTNKLNTLESCGFVSSIFWNFSGCYYWRYVKSIYFLNLFSSFGSEHTDLLYIFPIFIHLGEVFPEWLKNLTIQIPLTPNGSCFQTFSRCFWKV